MNKTELIEAIRTAQSTLGGKVNAASTLKSKNVEALEALLAGLQADIDAELNAAAAFVESELKAEQAQPAAEPEAAPAPKAEEADKEPKPLSRKQCNEALLALGYTGPTSYLMPILRHMVEWAKLGFQEDAAVPTAAHNHVAAADEE